jgi:hypothetical protein
MKRSWRQRSWKRAALERWVKVARARFPEAKLEDLPGKIAAFEKRRSKNKRARAARKRNR